jgi:predicted HTH domain antitoxin
MNANPVLLQMKYARVVSLFAEKERVSLDRALELFYHSRLYQLVKNGVSDMHCMSDEYLVEELQEEMDLLEKEAQLTGIRQQGSWESQ